MGEGRGASDFVSYASESVTDSYFVDVCGSIVVSYATPRTSRYYSRAHSYFLLHSCMFDPMSDLSGPVGGEDPLAPTSSFAPPPRPPRAQGAGGYAGGGAAAGSNRFGEELHSITIRARQRTFYIDLKQSSSGKFFKVSEKSRGGQKSTIVFDVEDLDAMIAALQEMKTKL